MNIEVIGQRIDEIRKARKWSYKELANRIGDNISPQTVSDHIRTGKMHITYLCKYAEALGCTVADLTDGTVNLEDFELTAGIESYWPYNMILAVFMGYDKNNKRKIPEYIHTCYEAYVPAVLESLDTLTEREKDVLIMRYKHGMTLEEVGKHYRNINKERVRQIEAKALRKLRHPSRSLSWQFDTLNKWKDSEKKASALLLENINLKRKLERIGLSEEQIAEPEREPVQENVKIDELELSVRSYNCLCRANIRYIKDLDGMTRAKLAKVRNLGQKSMEEVIVKAREWGIEIKDD